MLYFYLEKAAHLQLSGVVSNKYGKYQLDLPKVTPTTNEIFNL